MLVYIIFMTVTYVDLLKLREIAVKMLPSFRSGMALLSPPWIELLVMIQVYILAGIYAVKEIIFEVINQGIKKRLENEVLKSNAINHAGSKCVFITGGDGTIGREVIKRFLGYGYTVHATIGDRRKAFELVTSLGGSKLPLTLYDVDLLTPYEVTRFARGFVNKCGGLSIVIMCAGIMLSGPEFIDNVESHMCVNVVSQALLLHLLNPILLHDARILFLSSATAKVSHYTSPIFRKDPLSYYVGRYQAYCFSKLVLSVYIEQLSKKKSQLLATIHPGVIPGTLYRNTNKYVRYLTYIVLPYFLRKPAFGSLLIAHTAMRDDLISGSYYEDGSVKSLGEGLSEKEIFFLRTNKLSFKLFNYRLNPGPIWKIRTTQEHSYHDYEEDRLLPMLLFQKLDVIVETVLSLSEK
ncbi:oxidoreductase, short chain dehydrogenase/reductase family protein [Dictyocaulus viviparus]|uniref:Oxidoreductase, short chain dehydrogenase/reductase family protein n=1 Tax=Dictyocaulus viviparus TaxID=29172 RepID=A0A0D8XUQ0_DICVI|nr:oxidoreductase, short chain dehydrogenase/reductase family protein [Dictyocaulus viviparus]